jgi:hypothetical protein
MVLNLHLIIKLINRRHVQHTYISIINTIKMQLCACSALLFVFRVHLSTLVVALKLLYFTSSTYIHAHELYILMKFVSASSFAVQITRPCAVVPFSRRRAHGGGDALLGDPRPAVQLQRHRVAGPGHGPDVRVDPDDVRVPQGPGLRQHRLPRRPLQHPARRPELLLPDHEAPRRAVRGPGPRRQQRHRVDGQVPRHHRLLPLHVQLRAQQARRARRPHRHRRRDQEELPEDQLI